MKEADWSKIGSLGLKKKSIVTVTYHCFYESSNNFFLNHMKSLLFGKIPTYNQDLLAIFAKVNNYFGLFATHSFTNFKKMHLILMSNIIEETCLSKTVQNIEIRN